MLSLENSKRLSTLAKEFGVEVSDRHFIQASKSDLQELLEEVLDGIQSLEKLTLQERDYLDHLRINYCCTLVEELYRKAYKKYVNDWVSQDVIPALEEVIKNKKNV